MLSQQISTLLSHGQRAERAGRFGEARQAFAKMLELDPGNVEALTQLGLLDIRQGNMSAALTCFEEAVKREPKNADLRNNLAMVYLELGRPDKARRQAEIAKKRKSDAETFKILFECAYALNDSDAAISAAKDALKHKKDDPALTLDLAQALDVEGRADEACALFRSVIARGHHSIFAYDGIARSQTFESEPPEYAQMNALLAGANVSPREKLWFHSALGKIDDDLGRYDRAFEHFLKTKNPAHAAGAVAKFEKEIAAAQKFFTGDFFSERTEFANPSKRPVFIFGMPRSGTTLVEQILAGHPDMHGAGELPFFRIETGRIFPRDRASAGFSDAVRGWTVAAAKDTAGEYLALLEAHNGSAARVADKMPHNFEQLWLLALLFPNATFIHCSRDAVATCFSCFIQPLGQMHAYAEDLAALGRYYRLYENLMAFWREVLPIRIIDIRYEVLVRDPEKESRRIIEATGLAWDARCLDISKTKRAVRTPSRRQVAQPIYTQAIESWQRYEKYLGPLIEALDRTP